MELGLKDGECTILAVPASHVTGLVAQILTLIGCKDGENCHNGAF